jgi:aryl-alcohol dehydrogenase-like predicted oxidoreductase
MKKIKLGKTDLETAPLIFGGNVFGWTVDEREGFNLLDAFIAKGFNMIDTADSYSRWVTGNQGGESETLIGKWLKKSNKRNEVIIATKVGADLGSGINLSSKYIMLAVESSLKRLQTSYIDLYQSHYDDPNTKVDETLEAYDKLIKQGKVRYIGASNLSKARLLQSLEASSAKSIARYETLQPLYNLYDREIFENEYQQFCLENDISVIPYFSLASGFLTGKYRSEKDLAMASRGQNVKKYMTPKGNKVMDALFKVAAKHNTSPAQVSLAWLSMQPAVAAPIVSATNLQQLNELVQSVDLSLDNEDLRSLDVEL